MDNSASNGNISFLGTVFLGLVSWLTPENIDIGFKVMTGIGAVTCSILGARYYYYATLEKKRKLNAYNQTNNRKVRGAGIKKSNSNGTSIPYEDSLGLEKEGNQNTDT